MFYKEIHAMFLIPKEVTNGTKAMELSTVGLY